jgi:hypothetical protein
VATGSPTHARPGHKTSPYLPLEWKKRDQVGLPACHIIADKLVKGASPIKMKNLVQHFLQLSLLYRIPVYVQASRHIDEVCDVEFEELFKSHPCHRGTLPLG